MRTPGDASSTCTGTNHEALLGQPASHGCVRLANRDIIRLFPLVPRGTEVSIG